MTVRLYSNNFATTLDGAINDTVTTITLTSVTDLPTIVGDQEFRLTLFVGTTIEIVTVTAVAGFDLTVVRGEEGTTAVSWADASTIELRATDDSFERLAEGHIVYRATSTGILTGGVVTINGGDNTKFDVSAGTGIIVDSYTDTQNPTFTEVSWSAFLAQTPTYIGTDLVSAVAIDSTGAIVQTTGGQSGIDFIDTISLGQLVHSAGVVIEDVGDVVVPAYDPIPGTKDLSTAIGAINISGNIISANGTNLSLNKSSGSTFSYGSNFSVSAKSPHVEENLSFTAPTLFLSYRDGSGGWSAPTLQTTLDPGQYDDGSGTLQSTGNNNWTIVRVYVFSSNNNCICVYGQNVYSTQAAAEAAINTEPFEANPLLAGSSLRSFIIIKGNANDLTDDSEATLVNGGKFGETAGGGSGGSTTTLQQAYDNSSVPEILTDATREGLCIQQGSGADTDHVYAGQNGAGTTTFEVTGAGSITAAGAHDFGDATSLEIPNGATPTVDAAGEIAIDTTITDHTGLITYYDGVEALYAVGLPTANLTADDGYVIAYNATNNEFEMVAAGGGGASDFASLTDITISSTDSADDTASFDDIRFMRSGDPDTTNGGMTFKATTGTTTRFIGWGGNTSFPTPRLMGNSVSNYIGWDASDNMYLQNAGFGFSISNFATNMVGVIRFGSTDYIQNDFGRNVIQVGSTNSATAWIKLDCGTSASIGPEGAGSDLDLKLDPKGAGNVLIDTGSLEFTTDGEGIEDSSNQPQLVFNKTTSAVNHVGMTNAATAGNPKIAAEGTDTNITLEIDGKGTGHVKLPGGISLGTGTDVLEDYEEGTWTPTIDFATTGDLSVSYSTQDGDYIRTGNQVVVSMILNCVPTFTTSSGNFQIKGIPFTPATIVCHGAIGETGGGQSFNSFTSVTLQATDGSTNFLVQMQKSSTSSATMSASEITSAGAGVKIRATMTYFV